jgi:PAS domain S-box-containing protein
MKTSAHHDNDKREATAAIELRRHAEEQLKAKALEAGFPRTDDEARRLLHELQVHQVELEMQNAELRQARDKLEKALENYTELYDFAPVGYFTFDHEGAVHAANFTGSTLLGVERALLIGRRFGQFVAAGDRPAFTAFLGTVFASRGKEACEITLSTDENAPLFVHIEAVSFGAEQKCRVAVMDISKRKQAEEQVQRYNEKLRAVNEELTRFNCASLGRELRMIELKKEINELYIQSGRPPRYPLEFEKDNHKKGT